MKLKSQGFKKKIIQQQYIFWPRFIVK